MDVLLVGRRVVMMDDLQVLIMVVQMDAKQVEMTVYSKVVTMVDAMV